MQNIQLSVKNVIKEPWTLMVGVKRYVWLTYVPMVIMFMLTIAILVGLGGKGDNINVSSSMLNASVWSTTSGVAGNICIILLLLTLLFQATAIIITGCNIAKKEAFSRAWLKKAWARMWLVLIALVIVMGIYFALFKIKMVGIILGLFLAPLVLPYLLMVAYAQNPFKSLLECVKVIKGNYWRLLGANIYIGLLALLLNMTIIGIIWGVPFKVIAYGVIYRDLVEPRLQGSKK